MNTQEFNALTKGSKVTVAKSGKLYHVLYVKPAEQVLATRQEWLAKETALLEKVKAGATRYTWLTVEEMERRVAEAQAEVDAAAAAGLNAVDFVQIRANAKGVVGPYGPNMTLKPENIIHA